MRVYEKVREYVDASGLKRGIVADKAGINIKTFSAIMTGKRSMHAEDLRAICEALNVSPEKFIDTGPQKQAS